MNMNLSDLNKKVARERLISKIISSVSFIVVFGIIGYEYLQAMSLQYQFESFVSKGARFTAQDGQVLCKRVQALEIASYGYRDAGKKPLDCDYLKPRENVIAGESGVAETTGR